MSPSAMRDRSHSPQRPRRRESSPPRRERSPPRHRSPVRTSSRARSPPAREKEKGKEKPLNRNRSPKRPRSPSPAPRSPSPRTKRIRRAQLEKEAGERERGRNSTREGDKSEDRPVRDKKEVDRASDRERGRNSTGEGGRSEDRPVKDKKEVDRVSGRNSDKTRHNGEGLGDRSERRSVKDMEVDRERGRNDGREGDKVDRSERRSVRDMEVDRERGRNGGREGDKDRRNREVSVDRSERRSVRDQKEVSDRGRERSSGRDGEKERASSDRSERRSRHGQSRSPMDRKHYSRSPSRVHRGGHDEVTNQRGGEQQDDDDSVARMKAAQESLETKEKQKPSFELSGKLAEETNRVKGVTLLFTEPSDARKPDVRWRLYVFKAGEVLNEPLYIHRQTSYLFGRERRVADIPTDHPSCSKQHAVIQFRQVEVEKPDGMLSKQVRPYLMDLGSTNKTFLNDNAIEPQRYYELFEKDTIKFGNSSREYVILHENSA